MTAGTDIQSPADAATFIARLIEAARAFIVARVNAVSAAEKPSTTMDRYCALLDTEEAAFAELVAAHRSIVASILSTSKEPRHDD